MNSMQKLGNWCIGCARFDFGHRFDFCVNMDERRLQYCLVNLPEERSLKNRRLTVVKPRMIAQITAGDVCRRRMVLCWTFELFPICRWCGSIFRGILGPISAILIFQLIPVELELWREKTNLFIGTGKRRASDRIEVL